MNDEILSAALVSVLFFALVMAALYLLVMPPTGGEDPDASGGGTPTRPAPPPPPVAFDAYSWLSDRATDGDRRWLAECGFLSQSQKQD